MSDPRASSGSRGPDPGAPGTDSAATEAPARDRALTRAERKRRKAEGDLGDPTLRHRLEYAACRVFAAVLMALPTPLAYWLARRGGDFLNLVDRGHREVSRENLRRHYRDEHGNPPTEREVRRITRDVFRHVTCCGLEMLMLPRETAERGFESFCDVTGAEHGRRASEQGRGTIFVTAHVGNWEVLGAAAGHVGVHAMGMYRPIDNPLLDSWLRSMRTALGQELVSKYGAARAFVRELRKGGAVAVLIDQDARRRGVFVPFLGAPASTIRLPAELALRTGAAIVPGFALRVGGRFEFREWFDEPLEIRDTGDREADVRAIMTDLNQRLEAVIRRAPEQWLWVHRRWKTPPPTEPAQPAAQ